MTTRTRTRSAGGGYPHGDSYSPRGSKGSWSSQSGVSKYYAGAKFDTIPALSDLPMPPRHWTDPSARSQSTPSSPVTIPTKPTTGISLDMMSLFGPQSPPSCDKSRQETGGVVKSASLPGQASKLRTVAKKPVKEVSPLVTELEPRTVVFKTPLKLKARPTVKTPTKPKSMMTAGNYVNQSPVTPRAIPVSASDAKATPVDGSKVTEKPKVTGISGLDLMEMLMRASPTHRQDLNATPTSVMKTSPVKVSPCHLQLGSMDCQYKDISDHLKSILKVSA